MLYLRDTSVVNPLAKGRSPVKERYREEAKAGAEVLLCPIVHYEFLRYLRQVGATRTARGYEVIVADWIRFSQGIEDWESAAGLWVRREKKRAQDRRRRP